MSRDKQRLANYLAHILEAIERIDRYTGAMSEVAFLDNQMVQDAVIRNFEIIGEASHNIGALAFAYQMCNAVAHGYFKVDLEIVWKTIHSDLPELYRQVQELVESLSRDDNSWTTCPMVRVSCSAIFTSAKVDFIALSARHLTPTTRLNTMRNRPRHQGSLPPARARHAASTCNAFSGEMSSPVSGCM